jgi:hypothetical protein
VTEAQGIVEYETEAPSYEEEAAPPYETEARELCCEIQAQIGDDDEESLVPELAELRNLPAIRGAQSPTLPLNATENDKAIYYVTRRRIIERFMILGYDADRISEALSLSVATVKSDIAWIKAEAATTYDVEKIRLHVWGKYQQLTEDVEQRIGQLDKALDWEDEKGLKRKNPALIRARSQMAESRERHVYNAAKMWGVPTSTVQHKASKYTEMLGTLAKVKTIIGK